MSQRPTIPPNLVLPHFLKLILQNRLENEVAKAEAREALKEAADEDAAQEEVYEDPTTPEGEEAHDFDHFSAITVRSNAPKTFEPPTNLEVASQGKLYLDKGPSRRPGDNVPTKDVTDSLHRRWSRVVWRQELNNMEPVYRLPALILQRFRYIRDVEPSRLGPGTYDLDYEDLQKKKKTTTTRGVMSSCSSRFPKEKAVDPLPGPGSYGDPFTTYDRWVEKCKHPGRVSLFQSGPCNARTVMAVHNSNPGPGQYLYKPGTEIMSDKRTSVKGPFNLYSTAPRDVIPFGYFKTRRVSVLGPGQYNIRSTTKQELSNCCNYHKGKLAPCERFRAVTGERMTLMAPLWPRKDNRPGPSDYTPVPFEPHVKPFKYGFNSSSRARVPHTKSHYDMSPDKYRPGIWTEQNKTIGGGWKSDFSSKTGRLDLLKMAVFGERVRAKDIPHHQREEEEGDVSCNTLKF